MLPAATWAPFLVAAALMLGLAIWLLFLDVRDRLNVTFAAILSLRAFAMAITPFRSAAVDPVTAEMLVVAGHALLLPVIPLTVWFLASYPKARAFGRSKYGALALITTIVALEAAYLFEPRTMEEIVPAEGSWFAQAAPGLVYHGFGPLIVFIAGIQLMGAIAGLVLAREGLATPVGSRRYSILLVGAGFTLNALFDGTNLLLATARLFASGEAFPWMPWGWAYVLLPALTIVPAAAATYLLARRAVVLREEAHTVKWFLVAAPVAVVAALVLGSTDAYRSTALSAFVIGLFRLCVPVLVTYALLRHQLFDIDLRVKKGLRASAVAATFLAVFFTVSELAANVIQETVGTVLGIAAAVAMAFALRPVERMAEGLAHRIMPGVRPVEALRPDEREVFYREQLELALQDGNLGAKERAMLDRLRERLGLSPDATRRIESGYATTA